MVFRISDLSISFHGNPVLTNINVTLSAGSRIGIVGRNGCGKSTLVKAIVGSVAPGTFRRPEEMIRPDSGSIDWVRRVRIGYVSQAFPYDLAETPVEIIGRDRVAFLGRCGLMKERWDIPSGNLSGGEKTRLCLACAISEEPDLLILDEPTNHLDINGMEWLERTLINFGGTVLVVSHDRFFLDKVCTGIWEIRDGKLREYTGNYSSYLNQVRNEESHIAREREKWATEVKNLKTEVRERRQWYEKAHKDAGQNDFYRRKAKKHARQFKAKESALRRLMDNEPEKPRIVERITVEVSHRSYRTETLARATDVTFDYGAESASRQKGNLLHKVNFTIKPEQKVGLIGRNGSGKTTLLRLLTGELEPLSGEIWMNPAARIGHLPQMLENLDLTRSATENVCRSTGLLRAEARNLLGKLGITEDAQTQPTAAMSMGERARVALACLTFGGFDLLLLDEPTNHLDTVARKAIEDALISFSGSMVIATHDRYLLDSVCDTIWHIENGLLTVHPGNYSSYRDFLVEREIEPAERDAKAYELLLKSRLAHIASRIWASRDETEKEDLDRQYREVLKLLQDIKKTQ